MSNLIDAEAGTERFGGYEAELKVVQADLNQQIDEIPELTGEPRKAAIAKAERALEEANELVSWLPDQTPFALQAVEWLGRRGETGCSAICTNIY
jgi:vesicle transport through interaction with t-SNAREs 1